MQGIKNATLLIILMTISVIMISDNKWQRCDGDECHVSLEENWDNLCSTTTPLQRHERGEDEVSSCNTDHHQSLLDVASFLRNERSGSAAVTVSTDAVMAQRERDGTNDHQRPQTLEAPTAIET